MGKFPNREYSFWNIYIFLTPHQHVQVEKYTLKRSPKISASHGAILNFLWGRIVPLQDCPHFSKKASKQKVRKKQSCWSCVTKNSKIKVYICVAFLAYIVGCQGLAQLDGLVPVYWQEVPLRYKACKSILLTNDPSINKRKNTCWWN